MERLDSAQEKLVTAAPQASLAAEQLRQQTVRYRGTGGTSSEARRAGLLPAFLDRDTGQVYRACFADGAPAPMHLLDGLPTELVVARDVAGRVVAVKASIESGFVHSGRFVTRAQAAQIVGPLSA